MAGSNSEALTEDTSVAHAAKPARKKSAKPFLVLGTIVVAGMAAFMAYRVSSSGTESTDDAQIEADLVPMAARVGGIVLRVSVVDNQRVKAGDVLVEIDPADYAAKVKQLEAEVMAAKAQADAALAQVRVVAATSQGGLSTARAQLSGSAVSVAGAEAQVAVAKAALDRANSEAAKADLDLGRAEALRKDDAIPQAQVDTARAMAISSHAAVAQAKAQITAMEEMKASARTHIAEAQGRLEQSAPVDAQLAVVRANADLAQARVASNEASLEQARLQLGYTKIVAPSDGFLSRLAVRQGQLVQPSQVIVNLAPPVTYVVANFKETQVGKMIPGQKADIEIDAFSGRIFEGKIESTSPGTGARFSLLPPDNASGNFVKVVQRVPVKIVWVSPPDVSVQAGLSAEVTVHLK